ncbi:MAG: Uma2 family endonuclease [Gemmataceae bacterium]
MGLKPPPAHPPSLPPLLGEYEAKRLTAADLAALPDALPSGPVCYELHHGSLITMPPPGDIHGAIELKIASAILIQGEYAGHGKARCGKVAVVLGRNPDHIFAADVVFVSNARLPIRRSTEGYLETIPDLVVEVRSRNDTLAALARKADDYLRAGVALVWVVDPVGRAVIEYRTGAAARTYAEADTLAVDDLIPGFALSVRDALQT